MFRNSKLQYLQALPQSGKMIIYKFQMTIYAFNGFKKPVAKAQATVIVRSNSRSCFTQFAIKNKILHAPNILQPNLGEACIK